jgi:cytochrome c peroxidase
MISWKGALLSILWATLHIVGAAAAEPPSLPGLEVRFEGLNGASDTQVLPNLFLFVPAGSSPTSLLPPGNFSATYTGSLSVDLRGDYSFQAELNGSLTLEINGKPALESAGDGALGEPGKPIRLAKGANSFKAQFTSPQQGPARVRLFWIPRGKLSSPIPPGAFTHSPSDALVRAEQLRHGRELLTEHRCFKCHLTESKGLPELSMDAPSFSGIGSRLNYSWMAQWIENPAANRASARMPRIFHGPQARDEAEKTAAFLSSLILKEPPEAKPATSEQTDKGRHLFEALHCEACHLSPEKSDPDPSRISLQHVGAKFKPGALVEFLKNPGTNYAWIRMPDFKLTEDEAISLSGYLLSKSPARGLREPASAQAKEGLQLALQRGCLSCHSFAMPNPFKTKSLVDIQRSPSAGCLSSTPPPNVPDFAFAERDKEDLQALLATDLSSLARDTPQEFALRQTRLLNCAGCHGKFEGFPGLEPLGGKLKPEWSAAFIGGNVAFKPRPWLEARMPAFHGRAGEIAQGLAMLHGYPPQTPLEPPIDKPAAEIGAKLVSANGGFSCISCHAVGTVAATQVFEAAGINLAYSGERLLKPWFHRWVRNPVAMDPTTKMPVYFDEEGKSPLADIYEGDGPKQIEAIWQYIRLGDKMPPPP